MRFLLSFWSQLYSSYRRLTMSDYMISYMLCWQTLDSLQAFLIQDRFCWTKMWTNAERISKNHIQTVAEQISKIGSAIVRSWLGRLNRGCNNPISRFQNDNILIFTPIFNIQISKCNYSMYIPGSDKKWSLPHFSVNLMFQHPFISEEYSIFRFQNANIPWF